jgi:hypothetical protein
LDEAEKNNKLVKKTEKKPCTPREKPYQRPPFFTPHRNSKSTHADHQPTRPQTADTVPHQVQITGLEQLAFQTRRLRSSHDSHA